MKTYRLAALAAALSATVAFPAMAQNFNNNYPVWDRIGSVNFANVPDHEVEYGNFGGRVSRLSFRSVHTDAFCRNVSATFMNGRTRTIFSGTMPRGQTMFVDLPGRDRAIRRIDFDCRASAPRGTRVDIGADIRQYRAEWRASPEWARVWARMFPWAAEFDVVQDEPMVRLSRERFGTYTTESTLQGDPGMTTLALRPVDNDAMCESVWATFRNGRTAELNVNRRLVRNRTYEVDLPGARRNVDRIEMSCRGEYGRPVTIDVFGQ